MHRKIPYIVGTALTAAYFTLIGPVSSSLAYDCPPEKSETKKIESKGKPKINVKVKKSVGGLESKLDESTFRYEVEKGKHTVYADLIVINPGAAITDPLRLHYSLCFEYQDRFSCVVGKSETLKSGFLKEKLCRKIDFKQMPLGKIKGKPKITVRLEKGKEELYQADHYFATTK